MAAAAPLPIRVPRYLPASCRPDCGSIRVPGEERHAEERYHSSEQEAIPGFLREHRQSGRFRAHPELQGIWPECFVFAGCATGLRLDLAALFASIDDALADSGSC